MLRRSFLKLTAAGAGAAMVPMAAANASGASVPGSSRSSGTSATMSAASLHGAEVDFGGLRYRGTSSGTVETSADGGASWKLHTNFGSDRPVHGLRDDRGRLVASVGKGADTFALTLGPNAKHWYTEATRVATTPLR